MSGISLEAPKSFGRLGSAVHGVLRQKLEITPLGGTLSSESVNEKKIGGVPPWLPSFGTAALGGALFGSDIGTSSSVVRILGEGQSSLGALSAIEIGQIASVSLAGAIFAVVPFAIGDEDRKKG